MLEGFGEVCRGMLLSLSLGPWLLSSPPPKSPEGLRRPCTPCEQVSPEHPALLPAPYPLR